MATAMESLEVAHAKTPAALAPHPASIFTNAALRFLRRAAIRQMRSPKQSEPLPFCR
jgi:hypothetical protein